MKHPILIHPDPRLKKVCVPVADLSDSLRSLSDDMLETMYAESGIGLAATQVNIQKRIVVIDLSEERNTPLILVNPEITKLEGTESMREGCLSVPEYFDIVERAEYIEFNYRTLDDELINTNTDGLLAVCVQHEIDHLNGKLFIDYLSPLKRERLKKKIDKQIKQQQLAL